MTRLQGHGVARRIRVAEALLKIKAAKVLNVAFDAEAPEKLQLPIKLCDASVSECGVEYLRFQQDFTSAELTPDFCARADSLDFMLQTAVKTQAEHIEVMQKMADSYLSLVNSEGYQLDAASASWEALAKNVYTLFVAALLLRCSNDTAMQKALLWSLSLYSHTKLRSWPSKKQIEMLREVWAMRTEDERVILSTIQGSRMWWLHNCDYILGAREVREYITIFLPRTRVLKTTEDEEACKRRLDACRRSVGLEHFAGLEDNSGSERMFFTKEFFRQPRALDRILKQAVQQSSSRNELIKVVDAVHCPFELSSAAYRLIAEDVLRPMPTWQDLATVVYTLVLDAILTRCESCQALEAAMKQRMLTVEETNKKTTIMRQEKAKRKRQARMTNEASDKVKDVVVMDDTLEEGHIQEIKVNVEVESAVESCGSFTDKTLHTGADVLALPRPRREFYHGQWCGAVLPACQWSVRNTFVDVEIDDGDTDLVLPRRSCSCPASPR